jgi:spermidine/putrescine-binding protein
VALSVCRWGGRGIRDWEDLLQPRLQGRLAFVDSPRELVGVALKTLGLPFNARAADLRAAGVTPQDLGARVKLLRQQVRPTSAAVGLSLAGGCSVGFSVLARAVVVSHLAVASLLLDPAAVLVLLRDVWLCVDSSGFWSKAQDIRVCQHKVSQLAQLKSRVCGAEHCLLESKKCVDRVLSIAAVQAVSFDSHQVRLFSDRDATRALSAGDVWAVVGWSGDLLPLRQRSTNVALVAPASGTALWADVWVVPAGAAGGSGGAGPSPLLPLWLELGLQPVR